MTLTSWMKAENHTVDSRINSVSSSFLRALKEIEIIEKKPEMNVNTHNLHTIQLGMCS